MKYSIITDLFNRFFNSKNNEDAYPSAANYLKKIGWKKNEPCFYKIDLNDEIPIKYLKGYVLRSKY